MGKEKKTSLLIPDGYEVREHTETVSAEEACRRLSTKKQRRYTRAIRSGDTVRLVRHEAVCPDCGLRRPAYLFWIYLDRPRPERVSRTEIRAFCMGANGPEEETELRLNVPIPASVAFYCPRCERRFKRAENREHVRIVRRKNRLSVLRRIDEFTLGSVPGLTIADYLKDALYEGITFNARTGQVYITTENEHGKTYTVRSVRSIRDVETAYPALAALPERDAVRRRLKSFFRAKWDGPLPCSGSEPDRDAFFWMTRFTGYARSFYDALPYALDGSGLDRSFRGIARRLGQAKYVPRLLETSELPGGKCIRRLLFAEPERLFYLPELERLWELTGDQNLLHSVLEADGYYRFMAMLHQYPGCWALLRDHLEKRGAKAMCSQILMHMEELACYAMRYNALGPFGRKSEQTKWDRGYIRSQRSGEVCEWVFSVPSVPWKGRNDSQGALRHQRRVENRMIDGYRFRWLRNTQDCFAARRQLDNCLNIDHLGRVVVVCWNGKYLAAIEVRGHTVTQAFLAHNMPISRDDRVNAAYRKWLEWYGLREE